jgi:hypothetical protein
MLHIAYIVISSNRTLENKQGEIHLLLKVLVIGKKKKKKKEKIEGHVGAHNSAHNQARRKCEALLNHKQSIITFFDKQSDQQKIVYKTRLNASVDCVRFLQ